MKTGRPRKPTQLKILDGNPGRRPLNKREPRPPAEAPSCPAVLKGSARQEWYRMVGLLRRMDLLAATDRAALAMYCRHWALWKRAAELLEEEGEMVTVTATGYQQQSPYIAIMNKEAQIVHRLLVEFGLSPASRSRVQAPAQEKEEPPGKVALFGKRSA